MTTAAEIDSVVKTVTGWSQQFRQSANAITQRAHDQFMQDTIDLVAYSRIAQQMIGVLQTCIEMTDGAASMLSTLALAEIAPITQATQSLAEATAKIDKVQDIVTLAIELVAAVAAVGAVVATPTFAGVAAAGGAVSKVASGIAGI